MNLNERNASLGCMYIQTGVFVVSFMKKNGYNVTNYSEPCKLDFCACLHAYRKASLYGEKTT